MGVETYPLQSDNRTFSTTAQKGKAMKRTKAPAPIAAPVFTVATELAQRIAALGLTVSVEQFRTLLDEFHNLADELRIPMEAAYDGAEMFWATPYPPASSVCGMYNSYRDAIAAVAEAMEGNAFGLREIAPEEGHAMAYMVTIEAGPSSWVIYQPNKVSYWIIREDEAYSSPYVGSDGMNLEENENGRRVYFDKVGDAMAYLENENIASVFNTYEGHAIACYPADPDSERVATIYEGTTVEVEYHFPATT